MLSVFSYIYLITLCVPQLASVLSENPVSFYFKLVYIYIVLAGLELLSLPPISAEPRLQACVTMLDFLYDRSMIPWPQVLGMLGSQASATCARLWARLGLFISITGTISSKIEVGRLCPKDQI